MTFWVSAGLLMLVMSPAMAQAPPDSLATIEGVALGGDGLPLPGTRIMLANQASGQPGDRVIDFEATSDAFGRFAFQSLAAGKYRVAASHDGYEAYRGSPLGIAAGQHKTGVSIRMVPLAVLSGKVTDEDDDPMPGVTVNAIQRDRVVNGRVGIGGQPIFDDAASAQTDPAGEYRLMLPHGRWYLTFSPPRSVRAASPSAVPETAVHDEPEQSYVTTYYPGVPDPSLAAGLDVTASLQMPGLNVRLRKTPVFHVRGKVVGTNPAYPTKIAAVKEPFESEDSWEGQKLESDGTFDISGLYSGEWVVVAVGSGSSGFMESGPKGRAIVEVGNRDVENVVVVVQPPVEIRGSVKVVPDGSLPGTNPFGAKPRDATADSLAAMEVQLEPLVPVDWFTSGSPVQRDGTFTLGKVSPGRYRVDVKPPPGSFVKSVMFDGRECIDSGIDVVGEAHRGLQITVSMTAGTVTGTVANPDGALSAAVTVTLMPDGPGGPPPALFRPELYPIVHADAAGNFTVKNVVPGTYRVYAWEGLAPVAGLPFGEALAFADPEFPREFDNMSAVVTVGENESRHVSLNLISAARVSQESLRSR
jgi:Carboxypeptidase regulatory-like domain/Polysaccharide lyase family 4, domain II